jgi:two-component system, NarL family, response regulator NreC
LEEPVVTTILADDHVLVRQGLRSFLTNAGVAVLGEASDGHEAIKLVRELMPDVAILDLNMPRLNGVDAAKEILNSPENVSKVILLTMYSEQHYVIAALSAGIHGYVLKNRAANTLLDAIQEVRLGHTYLSPDISRSVMDTIRTRGETDPELLSVRERQVLQLVAEGMSTKAIAELLSISAKTAESHRTRIMQKLGIHDTAGLVMYAIRKGIIQP